MPRVTLILPPTAPARYKKGRLEGKRVGDIQVREFLLVLIKIKAAVCAESLLRDPLLAYIFD